jgi:hypothetical protein
MLSFIGKQKCKKKLRSKPERDNIIKDRLLLRQNDDKDETSSTTTDSSTGDLEEKVIYVCNKTKLQTFYTYLYIG